MFTRVVMFKLKDKADYSGSLGIKGIGRKFYEFSRIICSKFVKFAQFVAKKEENP